MPITKYTAAWLNRADEDMYIAELVLREKGPPNQICFHAQQAVEKYLKGFLAFHAKHVRKVHDLDLLVAECIAINDSFHGIRDDAVYLTRFYIEARYPGDIPEFSLEEAKKAYETAIRIKNFVAEKIKG